MFIKFDCTVLIVDYNADDPDTVELRAPSCDYIYGSKVLPTVEIILVG